MFSRSEKILLSLLAFIQFSHIVDFMIMMPLGPQFMKIFNIQPDKFGFLVSSYTFSAGLMSLIAAFFVDKYDRKKTLLFFYLGFSISTLACALSTNFISLLAARTMAGAFGGVLSSLVLAIVGDSIVPEKRASAMGIVMMSFSAASILGVPFSLYLANHFNWHAPFMYLGSVSLIAILVIIFKIPSIKKHLETPSELTVIKNFKSILSNKNNIYALLFMMFLVLGQFTVIPFISPSLILNVGLTNDQLPYIYLIGGSCTFFSSPLIGRLSDHYGKKLIFTYGLLVSLLPIYFITTMKPAPLPYVLTFTAILFVSVGGRMIPAMALVTSTVKPNQRGSFMSLNGFVQQISSALAAYIASQMIIKTPDEKLLHYDQVGYLAIGLSLMALLLVRRIKTVE